MKGRSISPDRQQPNNQLKRDVANQTCKQTWNAAISVGPNLAANDAANVTQNVTAITLINNRNPEIPKNKREWNEEKIHLVN